LRRGHYGTANHIRKILKSLKAKEAAKAEYYIYKPPAAADKILARAAEIKQGQLGAVKREPI